LLFPRSAVAAVTFLGSASLHTLRFFTTLHTRSPHTHTLPHRIADTFCARLYNTLHCTAPAYAPSRTTTRPYITRFAVPYFHIPVPHITLHTRCGRTLRAVGCYHTRLPYRLVYVPRIATLPPRYTTCTDIPHVPHITARTLPAHIPVWTVPRRTATVTRPHTPGVPAAHTAHFVYGSHAPRTLRRTAFSHAHGTCHLHRVHTAFRALRQYPSRTYRSPRCSLLTPLPGLHTAHGIARTPSPLPTLRWFSHAVHTRMVRMHYGCSPRAAHTACGVLCHLLYCLCNSFTTPLLPHRGLRSSFAMHAVHTTPHAPSPGWLPAIRTTAPRGCYAPFRLYAPLSFSLPPTDVRCQFVTYLDIPHTHTYLGSFIYICCPHIYLLAHITTHTCSSTVNLCLPHTYTPHIHHTHTHTHTTTHTYTLHLILHTHCLVGSHHTYYLTHDFGTFCYTICLNLYIRTTVILFVTLRLHTTHTLLALTAHFTPHTARSYRVPYYAHTAVTVSLPRIQPDCSSLPTTFCHFTVLC